MGIIGTMVVKLIADAEEFERQFAMSSKTLRGIERQFDRTSKRLERLGTSMMLGVTAPMTLIGGSALKMAMDAVEAQNLFEVTMGDMAGAAQAFSERLRDQFGLSTDAVNQQQAAFFRQFKLYGIGRDQALQMAQSLAMLTNDLSSFADKDASDVLERLQSGLRGETDAVEVLGISLADSIVKQVAYRNGLAKQGQELSEQQKQLARYMAIVQQTGDAQGDLARTIDSPSNQWRILKQRLAEANKEFGKGLIPFLQAAMPMLQRMATALNNAAVAFRQMPPVMQEMAVWGGLILMATGPVAFGLGMLAGGVSTVAAGLNSVARFGKNAFANLAKLKAGTASLGSVMVAIFGTKTKLIIAAILGIAVAAALLIANWRAVSAAAARVWGAISAVVLYAASLIVRGLSLVIRAVSWLIPALRPAADAVSGWADSLKGAAGSALATARSASAMQQVGSSAQQAAASANQAAQAQENLGESMKDTAKAAGDNLQSFDQVHQLQEKMSDSPAATPAANVPAMAIPDVALPSVGGIGDLLDGLTGKLSSVGESVSGIWTRMGQAISQAWDSLLQRFPLLQSAVDGVNAAFGWIQANWPTIGPIVEGIASVLSLALVPALIRAGIQATVSAGQMVKAWAASAAGSVKSGWAMVYDMVKVGLKWVWMGIQATANAIKMAVAWGIAMGPVGWVIMTLAAVGAALVALWATNDNFRARVTAAWEWIKAQAVAIWGAVSEFLTTAWGYIRDAGLAIWAWLTENLLPLWEVVAAAGADIWASLKETLTWLWSLLEKYGTQVWSRLSAALTVIWGAMRDFLVGTWRVISTILQGIWKAISAIAMVVWDGLTAFWADWGGSILRIMSAIWRQIQIVIKTAVNLVRDVIGLVLAVIRGDWGEAWSRIKSIGATIWMGIVNTAKNVVGILVAVWQGVANTLSRVWGGLKDTAYGAWRGLANGVIGMINRVIDAINGMVRGLNSISFDVPDWVPKIGGKSWGFDLGTIPHVPMLAEGGTIAGRGSAIVGEAGAELIDLPRGARVTPLSGGGGGDLAQAIGQAVYAAVRQAMQATSRSGSQDEVVLQIDGQRFARLILPAITREGQRIGSPVLRIQEV